MMTTSVPCAEFEARLAEYLEPAGLDARQRARLDAHRATCAPCDALAHDLQALVADAAALPPLTPDRDLWAGISERIAPRVVALPRRHDHAAPAAIDAAGDTADGVIAIDAPHRGHPPRVIRTSWFAAAAAALVAVTAGVTWQLARATAPTTVAVAPTAPPATAAPDTPAPAGPSAATPTPRTDTRTAPARASAAPTAPLAVARRPRPDLGDTRTPPLPGDTRAVVATAGIDAGLTREIDALRDVVDRRYGELDSTTVAVVRRNLAIIDAAIADSRRALRQDPNSRFLAEQLDRALVRKVELLRQVALLERGT
jgi:hypothetical protein